MSCASNKAVAFGLAASFAIAAVVAACSEDSSTANVPSDAGAEHEAASEELAICLASTDAPAWLDTFLDAELAKLTGGKEIAPGVTLADRATAARRTVARDYLAGELRALGLATSIDAYTSREGPGANVVARLPATHGDAKDSIVVGAHFDGADGTPGANDNASGVVSVLAIAKILAAQTCRDRGVVFVMFDQEEVGLIGSTAFAAAQVDGGAAVRAVHTIDQVGWDADGDRTFEIELPSNELYAEYEAAAATVGAKVVKTTSDGSDHQPLRERGFPAVGITEEYVSGDTSPHRHKATDTPATIDRAYEALAVRLVALVVARELGAE